MQIEPPKSFLVETADGDEIRISVDRKDLTDVKTNIKTGSLFKTLYRLFQRQYPDGTSGI